MSALIIFNLTLFMLLSLPLMSQPLSLGLMVMLSTLMMCIISAMTLSSWYGYILFLIYVGGLLVMFAYVAALSPNVLFGSASPMLLCLAGAFCLTLIMYFYPLIDLSSITHLNMYTKFKFLKMYGVELVSPQMISVLVGLAIILLINLIVVVKICYYQRASLRPFN
uniref:NADH dehydrogenase subunit 6 n=1 Tax=Gemmuloborsonia moosai TaxID=651859 RepID=A0A344H1H7_GEMMO|nr:NADH dehydrogenase subunit 6 [Gemmuloborsonia moosai]AXA45242.1 NADH dehydrogenase subunit 6 [Gemmuloborsonia moosai]